MPESIAWSIKRADQEIRLVVFKKIGHIPDETMDCPHRLTIGTREIRHRVENLVDQCEGINHVNGLVVK